MVLVTKEFVMALYARSIIAEVRQLIPQGMHGEDAKNSQKKKTLVSLIFAICFSYHK
jgi:hypothetical protein